MAAAKTLAMVARALDHSPAAHAACIEPFRESSTIAMAQASEAAPGTLAELASVLKNESGVATARLTEAEISSFFADVPAQQEGVLTPAEYQAIMATVAKYAALRARRSPAKRWSLGLGLSTAAGVAVGAGLRLLPAVGAAGLAAAVAPVGVTVLALGLGGRKLARRDRRRATAAAPAAASLERASSTARSDDVSAMVAVVPPHGDVAALPGAKEGLLGGSAAANPTPDSGGSVAAAADEAQLPQLLCSLTPEPAESEGDDVRCASPVLGAAASPAAGGDGAVAATAAALPPLAVRKPKAADTGAKKLRKSISKSFKSFKESLVRGGSGDLDTPLAAPDAGRGSMGNVLRRSFSRDTARVSDGGSDGGLAVQTSEGSATIRKMRDMLRRSFTITTPRASEAGSSSAKRMRAF